MNDKKAQLDMKGMAIKYFLALFFVAITVVALAQIGIIGKITPGGGVQDLGATGPGYMTGAAVTETQENTNETKINQTQEITEENTDTE